MPRAECAEGKSIPWPECQQKISIYDQMIIVEKTYGKSVVGRGQGEEDGNDAIHTVDYIITHINGTTKIICIRSFMQTTYYSRFASLIKHVPKQYYSYIKHI